MNVGDQVLVLLPTEHSKLLLQWKGPYKVVGVKYENDYQIDMDGTVKTFHMNLLKKYHAREEVEVSVAGVFDVVGAVETSVDNVTEMANVEVETENETTDYVESTPSAFQK